MHLKPCFLLPILLALGACASVGGPHPVELPPHAEKVTRTEANGDVITEYRVDGQLRMIEVKPPRGPGYYLYERNGSIVSSRDGDNPPQTYFKLFSW